MIRGYRAYIEVEADEKISYFTGTLVKTLVYTLAKEIRIYKGLRGIISGLHLSPLFKPGKRSYELGELVSPVYVYNREEDRHVLVPVEVNGEYIIHFGGDEALAGIVAEKLQGLRERLAIKVGDSIVTYKVEGVRDITSEVMEKEIIHDKTTVYLKGPVKLFNVYTPSRLPKYNISAYELLMAPYMLLHEAPTITTQLALEAMEVLGLLVETYYSLNTVKPILLPFKGKEPGMIGKITYIIDTDKKEIKQEISKILSVGELAGVGESRQNGFGTITWKPK
ncbi:MAG: CRISPR system precrRNA processing endoribonuclease RAMP protein Cas6 [Desulfurococcales archaeon]|nr:CRISPR system precrRNA processing endoribonuclease RAMP protein Cas6 [Desulfurococcales archaeon]